LRDLFAASSSFFDRGGPVKVVKPADGSTPVAAPLTKHGVAMEAHRLCEPVQRDRQGNLVPVTLPERVAQMYLETNDWDLPPLAGISTTPLLSSDGSIRVVEGYDSETALWCASALPVDVPTRPTIDQASDALEIVRHEFRTFPFADAVRRREGPLDVVDLDDPPGQDESAFLVALITAVCRPSLLLAPGFLITAPAVSGAGSGKGLLVRAINAIAFGLQPRAFTMGGERHELDKRLAAELIEAQPGLFLDNANGTALRSDTLASVLTERPARVRLLGQTRMVCLNSTAFVAITGNGLSVTEDLARRFIYSELDAHCEDPESRPFAVGFLENINCKRNELLAAVLTIWRFGRQNAADLDRGKPLGSFETWAEWCRDPLSTLGCCDPVERIELLKSKDPRRQRVAELFTTWWQHHGSSPIAVNDLDYRVKAIVDPQGRGRQYLAMVISGFAGTRAAGFVLSRQPSAGRWTAATYALAQESPADDMGHRTHRTHGNGGTPYPMGPMPDGTDNEHWRDGSSSAQEPHWPWDSQDPSA
jgi:putative DNA primase/helicase